MTPICKNHRRWSPEIMDEPDVAEAAHVSALRALIRINHASLAAIRMAEPIIAMARRRKLKRLTMLDVACGGGDVPIGVALRAKNAGIEIHLTLLDRSVTALQFAASIAKRKGIPCQCVHSDCLKHSLPTSFDVATNSLFLHHIPEPNRVVDFLGNIQKTARYMVLINDLRRCRDGLFAAWLGGRIFTRSDIVRHDGPVSARSAWTTQELAGFASDARIDRFRIERSWPWRMFMISEAAVDKEQSNPDKIYRKS